MKSAILALTLCLSTAALAIDDTPDNRSKEADRYLVVAAPKEMLVEMTSSMLANLPAERHQEFTDLMNKHFDVEAFSKAMHGAMVKHFTADELAALADFYGSPVGKSAMKKMGPYMAEVMPAIQAEMVQAQQRAAAAKK